MNTQGAENEDGPPATGTGTGYVPDGRAVSPEVINVSESEEDFIEASDKSEIADSVPELDFTDFETYVVKTDISLVQEPKRTCRGIKPGHVPLIKAELQEKGYIPSVGTISVTIKQGSGLPWTEIEEQLKGGELTIATILADGRHRKIALTELSATDETWAGRAKRIEVTVWVPINRVEEGGTVQDADICASLMDILSIGAYLNRSSSTVAIPTFQDQVYATVSMSHYVHGLDGAVRNWRKPATLAHVLKKKQTLGRLGPRQLKRYAAIGIRLAMSPAAFEAFIQTTEACKKMTLVHVTGLELLSLEDEAFVLALKVTEARLKNEIVGRFEDMRKQLFRMVKVVYNEIVWAAGQLGKTSQEVLKGEFKVSARTRIPIEEAICMRLSNFKGISNSKRLMRMTTDVVKWTKVRVERAFTAYETQKSPARPSEKGGAGSQQEGAAEEEGEIQPVSPLPQPGQKPNPEPETERTVQDRPRRSKRSKGTVSADVNEEDEGSGDEGSDDSDRRDSSSDDSHVLITKSGRNRRPTKTQTKTKKLRARREAPASLPKPKRDRSQARSRSRSSSSVELARKKRRVEGAEVKEPLSKAQVQEALQNFGTEEVVDVLKALRLDVVPSTGEETTVEPGNDPKFPPAGEKTFDDRNWKEAPVGYEIPVSDDESPADNNDEVGKWVLSAYRVPSEGMVGLSTYPEFPGVVRFLETIFIPNEHRANLVLRGSEVMLWNQRMVYWRAAYNHLRKHPFDGVALRDDEEKAGLEDTKEEIDHPDKTWGVAYQKDTVAYVYFARRGMELESRGYCILEGFLDDQNMPEGLIQTVPAAGGADWYMKLRKSVADSFPGAEKLRERTKRTEWDWIINSGEEEDAEDGNRGIARYITTNFGVTEAVESDPARSWMCRNRALLDMRIAQSVAALRVADNYGREEGRLMFIPRTGGRWLFISKGCKRQQLHADFKGLSREETVLGTKNPGYFTVSTGEDEVPLWVCEYSHRLVAMASESTVRALGMGMNVIKVRIPPFSIFVGRGDVFHAGAGYDDYEGSSGKLRYHMYFVPQHYTLPDGVHLLSKFQPRFRSQAEADSDEDEADKQLAEMDDDSLDGSLDGSEDQ